MKQEFYRQIIQHAPFGYAHHEIILDRGGKPCDYRFIEVNAAFERLTGLKKENLAGRTVREAIPGIEKGAFDWIGCYGKIALEGGEEKFQQYSEPLDKWFWVHVYSPEKMFFTTIFTDIPEPIQTKDALIKSEELNRRLLATIPDIVIKTNLDGMITFVNDSGLENYPFITTQKLLGRNIFSFFTGDDLQRVKANARLMFEKPLGIMEYTLHIDDNHCIDCEVNGDVLKGPDNNPEGMVFVIRDITERKRSEKALKESESRNRALLEAIPDIMFVIGKDGFFIDYHAGNPDDLFQPPEEFLNKHVSEVLSPELATLTLERIEKVFQTGKPQVYEYRVEVKGEIRHFESRIVYSAKDSVLSNIRDITERKQIREALQLSEKEYHEMSTLFRLMADNMPDMLWAKNLNREYIFANKAICDNLLNAADTEEPLGKTDMFFASRERDAYPENPEWHTFGEICRDSDTITLQEMKPMQFDEFGNVKGKFLFLDVRKAPFYNDQGQLIGVVGSARDVTAAKEAESQLRQLSQAVEQSPATVVITKPDGKIEYVNQKFTEVTGYTFEEAKGQNPNILKSGKQPAETYRELWETIIAGKEWKGEFYNKKKNGKLFWESAFISPIKNENGEITHFLAVKEDITEYKKIHDNIKITKDTYQNIFNAISEAIYIIDESGTFIDVNLGAEKMYGYTREELIGKSPATVSAPGLNDLEAVEQTHREVSETGIPEDFEFWGVRKNREVFPKEVIINKGRYFGKDCIIATAREITERKRAETAQKVQYNIARSIHTAKNTEDLLEIVRQELGQLFDTTNFFVAMYNPETEKLKQLIFRDEMDSYEEWPASRSISGQVVKTSKTIFLRGDEINAFIRQHNIEVLGTDSACWLGVPILIRNRVAGVMVIQNYTDPNAYNDSDVVLFEMIAHETGTYIEKQKMIEDLVIAKERAEESDQLKTAFLQNLSHEIRTPLNGIIGFADLINDPDITAEDRRSFTSVIIERGWQLTSIINDILTISALETKQEQLKIEQVDINQLISEQLTIFARQADRKGIQLISKHQLAKEHTEVYVDKTKIVQILNNLLNNAIIFTKTGEIELGCQVKGELLEFFVRDTGIGIDKNKLDFIFERFVQADDLIRQDYGGIGLGLSICKDFLELMEGEIWVESEPGKGSTFFFTIPYHPVKDIKKGKDDTREAVARDKIIRVLVAEDEEMNFRYIETLLHLFNFQVIHARNGQEAVDLCKNETVDVVLMDIKMPVMNGYTAAVRIREFKPKQTIIAQSAYASPSEIKKYGDVFDDYLTKPFSKEKLINAFSKFVNISK